MKRGGAVPVAVNDPRYFAGLTAIGLVVLAAVAYSLRIAIDPDAGNHLLTATFLLANIVGWALGYALRRRDSRSVLGLILILLGDAIFPLNLFAPLMLFVPGLRGNVPLSVTAVMLVGIGYHLWNYSHRERIRFAYPFYPYYLALAGGIALVLTPQTTGAPLVVAAWLLLLYAVAFNELSYRVRPEPESHFAIAGAVILTCSLMMSAIAFRDRAEAALVAIFAGTLVLIASALRERSQASMARAHGLAAWLGVTITSTALLYYVHSPLWVYIVATGAWTLVLSIVSTLPARGWTEPFHESAWWAAITLASALTAALWRVWMPFIIATLALRPPRGATAAGLAEAGLALLLVSSWRRRYPAIAATLRGFVINNALLRLTSYSAPLLLILALSGAWPIVGAPAPASVYAPLLAGMLLLIAGPRLERRYPVEALDFAGVLALVFSAFNGLASATLSASVLFAAAFVLLIRYVRGAHAWTFGTFLVLTTGGLVLQHVGTPTGTVVFLVAAAVLAWGSSHASNAMARLGYWTAHAAGFVFWLSLARMAGFGNDDNSVVLATWSWCAFAAWRLANGRVAAQTSLQACAALILASLGYLFVQPPPTAVTVLSLLILGALCLELRAVRLAGFALLALAVVFGAGLPTPQLAAVLGAAAAILLWQSLARGSSFAHLLFTAAAISAAYLLIPAHGALRALPMALLVTLFLLVELLALNIRTTGAYHADLTSFIALVLAVVVLVAETGSTRFSLAVLALVLLSIVVLRPWIGAAEGHRVQPVVHGAFHTIALVAAALIIVASARLAGFTAGQQIFALACTTWIALWRLLSIRRGTAAGVATAGAFHVIGISVYVSALLIRNSDPFLLLACAVTAGAYVAWSLSWRRQILEHLAGAGAVEAVCLWGLARHITWPEFYLSAVCAYLCVVLIRQVAPAVRNAVAVVLIAGAVAWPYVALLRTAQRDHLVFLGVSSIVVIHVLLTSRRHVLLVITVCAMLGLGMLFGAAVLHDDVRLNMLMALVGFLVIADLGMIGSRSDARGLVGEISYDDNRVTR